ncbi:MAG TPA: tetratricopeptide repeat protein [Kofleriaceae bacterium]|nr:tetratricopeptide repeat protein [Kofleriaceae bacterium]
MAEPSATIDVLIRHERYRAAQQAVDEQLAAGGGPAAELLRARLQVARGGVPLDEVILRLDELIASGVVAGGEAGLAHELIASAFVRKRLPGLAREAIASGRAGAADRPGFHALEADIALVEDDRPAARAALERALAMDPALGAARLGLGHLLYVMADFTAAEAELARVPQESRHWGAAMRGRAAIAAARGERERESQLWRALLDCRPDGDNAQSDRVGLGLSLAALGNRDAAREAFRAAWQHAPDSDTGRYARERMTHLEAAPAGTRRVELTAFPTTAQKWNYCGPAVLELVLRYFDFTADQDAIAGVIKREHGTPMFEIVGYLAQMGVEARRVEVNAARIKRAIDLGCPVIVQEEYSTSSHVAVLTGYDDALGVFVAQDPMRHQPMLKSFTFTEAAGDLFGNGAIVVLGPEAVAAGRRAGCDEAGLVERRHLALVDECSRRRRRVHGDGHEELAPAEVVRFCDEALALAPDFKLARYLRFRALRALTDAGQTDREYLLRDLAVQRTRYPGDEWPFALHASLLLARGLHDEAFVAFLDAHRRDRHDEDNLQGMGEARWLAGDLASAETYLLRALAGAPDTVRASENLTAVYLRAIEAIGGGAEVVTRRAADGDTAVIASVSPDDAPEPDYGADGDTVPDAPAEMRGEDREDTEAIQGIEGGRDDGDDGDAEVGGDPDAEVDGDSDDDSDDDESARPADQRPRMPPTRLRTRPALPRDQLVRRARHFSRVALASQPDNPFNHLVAGELARRTGELPAAAAALARCLEIDPERHAARRALAAVFEQMGDVAGAERELDEMIQRSPDHPDAYLARADFLRRTGRTDDAAGALGGAVERVTGNREKLVRPLFAALEQLGTGEAAAAQLRALAERHLGDDDFLREAVSTLDNEGQRGHALALARHVVERAPGDPGALWQLARLLDDSGVHRDEARACFERVVELAPAVPVARVRLAWLLLAGDPSAALAVLEPVLAAEDSDVYDAQSACLWALGRRKEAERALSRALQAAPSPILGLAMLIHRHTMGDRYERAHQLAGHLDLAALAGMDEDDVAFVERCWLTAHRLAGRTQEVLERVRARCADAVPEHLAFEIYYACRSLDRELAARAADVRVERLDDPADRAEWKVIAAGLRARHSGDSRKLDAMAQRLPPHAGAWAELSFSYERLDRYADADAAAARAFELDPRANDAFTAWIEALERQNQIERAIACAEEFAAARPYEHQGPERLGIILAKTGRIDEALAHSARAMEAAPYCHVSQQSRALALFMAGDYAQALEYARRASGNEPSAPDSKGSNDDELLIAALTGDMSALERGLAALERSDPGVYPLYRERLRVAASTRAARP